MKNMKFILPKLFGLSILAAIGAMLLATIAKILFAVSLLGAMAYFIRSRFKRRHEYMYGPYGMPMQQGFHQMPGAPQPFYGYYPAKADVQPVMQAQRPAGIIPIN